MGIFMLFYLKCDYLGITFHRRPFHPTLLITFALIISVHHSGGGGMITHPDESIWKVTAVSQEMHSVSHHQALGGDVC